MKKLSAILLLALCILTACSAPSEPNEMEQILDKVEQAVKSRSIKNFCHNKGSPPGKILGGLFIFSGFLTQPGRTSPGKSRK